MRKIFALFAIACATAVSAAVFDHLPTDAELVNRSELVVIGTVRHAASRVRPDNGWVITDYELAVEETVKGTATPTITLTEVGGVADGRFTVIGDAATYRPGEQVMVFLHRAADGSYSTTAMQFGKFERTRNAQGASVLVRDTGEFGAEPARLEREFKAFVRGDAEAAYLTMMRQIAPAFALQAEFTAYDYTVTATDITGATAHIRWPGQPGFSVPAFETSSDPGGVISAAASQWSTVPSSFISLSRTIAAPPPTPGLDGHNGIYLDYNAAPPNGVAQCDGALACTIESGTQNHTFNGQQFFSISDADILVRSAGMGALSVVILHEMGHSIGLRHSNDGTQPSTTQAVMNSSVSFSSLQQWDKDAAATVYGSGPPCQQLTITGQSSDATIPAGSATTLSVSVNGTNPNYQWYDGVKPDTSTPVGTNSQSFTTPPINSVKHYWVRASNACSSVDSNTITITPQAQPGCTAPHITQQPSGGTINSGQTFALSFQASGTSPLSIQWYEGQQGDKSTPVAGATAATFTTPPLTQTKSYWVDVLNACGEDKSQTATVTVRPAGQCNKPSFTIQPQTVAGQAGQPAILFALATGDAPITYQWFQGNLGDTSTPLASQPPSNARWISQIFVDLLGRVPSAGDIATFTALLGSSPRPTVALTVLTSAEYRTNLLGSWFAQYLHRAPSAADTAFFMPMFTAGFTDEQIVAQMLGSAEYFTLAGGSNTAFISRVFSDVLGRSPSAADTTLFLTLLGSTSRTNVALTVLNSAEARTRLVQSYFARLLRRSATSAEAAGLLGGTDEQAIASIVGSDEYFNFPNMLITPALTKTTNFWVRASNSCGTTDSALGIVRIDCPLPVITTQPPNATVNVGQAPTIPIVANGASAYQWFIGARGVETNPITGATGPVLGNLVINTAGMTTTVWVKVSNGCGSVNSLEATITVNCSATRPVISAPPVSPSTKAYPISWTGNIGAESKYELQESATPDFTGGVHTFTITDATSLTINAHTEVTKDTRFYYRVRAFTRCPADPSAYSTTASVLVTAPLASNRSDYSFAQLPCTDPPCLITQTIHLDGFNASGKTGIESTDSFSISSDEPWLTVSPSSGNLPPGGQDVTMTIDAAQLGIGSSQATVAINRAQGAGKTGVLDVAPKTNVPVSVSLVAPVTPKPKDGNAPFNALLIPATAHADGIGTRFVTDMRLTNTASQSITYDLTFTPSNIDGTTTGKQMTVTVAPASSMALNDLVKDWFGSGTEGEVGIGSVEIRPRNFAGKTTPVNVTLATVASSRTYAVASTGTFGQFIPALPLANFLAKSSNSVISLQQVAQSPAYRTNLGLVEGLGQSADVVVSLFDDHHNILAQRSLTLRPFESQQTRLDSFFNGFTTNGVPLPAIADARVEVSVTSDSGRVTAYASVLDNATTDPLLVFPVDPSTVAAKRFVVPGVAEFDNGFSNFHTDMRLYNAASTDANVTLNFSGSASLPAVQRTVPAGQVLAIDNVLPTLWNATGGGAVSITTDSDAQLVVTARTFSRDASGGTFGQFIPGVTATDAVGNGDRALNVVQLEQSPQFRSNLGLVEVTGNPVTVEVLGYSPDSKIAARAVFDLAAGEFKQPGSIFSSMGFGDVYNGRITVRAIGGTGKVAAYGSVVDNRTADPTYVPAQ